MQQVISITQPILVPPRDIFASAFSTLERKAAGLFGCRHSRMSWPITRNGRAVRTCVKCGMSRNFDPQSWETFGPFYRCD